MPLVLGIDSSTQSTKAVLVDADDGTVVEQRTAAHPPGTSVDPRAWIEALDDAAGPLLPRAEAVAVGGQQHGAVMLDESGEPVHDALLWNDLRSAAAATELVDELGGAEACAELTGSVLIASYTVTKLRWLRDHEPDAAASRAPRAAAARLPHLAPRRARRAPHHRPRRRVGHRLLLHPRGRLASRACSSAPWGTRRPCRGSPSRPRWWPGTRVP